MVIQHKSYPICPPWLKPLISAKFFDPCGNHSNSPTSGESSSTRIECNLFCLDCMSEPLCFGCTFAHKNHHIVQIRRSSYHDVIRVSEIQKVLDLSGVQSYIINSARVVFLNGRPQSKLAKGVTNTCEVCARSLNENFRYCSLGCKLQGIDKRNDLTFIVQPRTQQLSPSHQRLHSEDAPAHKKSRSSKRTSAAKPSSSGDSEETSPGRRRESRKPSEDSPDSLTRGAIVSEACTKAELGDDSECRMGANAATGKGGELEAAIGVENLVEISPSTPPQFVTSVCHQRAAKRRKGTPHRSHLGGLTLVN